MAEKDKKTTPKKGSRDDGKVQVSMLLTPEQVKLLDLCAVLNGHGATRIGVARTEFLMSLVAELPETEPDKYGPFEDTFVAAFE